MDRVEFSYEPVYNMVYDHFKEQDQLRNSIILAFVTITGFAYQFLDKNLMVFGGLFLIGCILQLIICRHKLYGEKYQIILYVIGKLMPLNSAEINQNVIDDIAQIELTEYKKDINSFLGKIKKVLWSVDGLIYLVFVIVNSWNLNTLLVDIIKLGNKYFLFVGIFYIIFSIYIYYLLIAKRMTKLTPVDLKFIQFF